LLAERVVQALRKASDVERTAAFNVQRIHAGDGGAESAIAAARTVPMMARRRLVIVTGVDKWDKDKREDDTRAHPLDVLADYAMKPVDSTLLLLVASKINGARRLMRAAKKDDFLVSCDPLRRHELPGWIRSTARTMGHEIAPGAADALAELCGPELGPVLDALERLSLYVGNAARIDEQAVAATITRVRLEDVWSLVDAVAARDLDTALGALSDVASSRDEGPRLLGAIGSRIRQLVKFEAARRAGQPASEAAKAVGVPPFRANDLDRTVSKLPRGALERWIMLMAEADLALKGSKRDGREVLATMLLAMCR
jgi:DNA polymerase-3 subunit delta